MPALTDAFSRGLHADRPLAAPSNAGYYYFETDTNGGTLFQSDGSAWAQLAAAVNVGISTEQWSFALRDSDGTIDTTDRGIIVNASAGPVTLEMPNPIDSQQILTVKKLDASSNAVHLHSPYAIDSGDTTYDLTIQNAAATFATYAGFWYVVSTV